jgi:3-isopropylmalate dehydrogenase
VYKRQAIENAVVQVLNDGYRTPDIMESGGKPVNTEEMGDRVVEQIVGY